MPAWNFTSSASFATSSARPSAMRFYSRAGTHVRRWRCFSSCWNSCRGARDEPTTEIYLPMNRSDIGEYVGMSLEAVSRAFRGLTATGIIKFRDSITLENLGPRNGLRRSRARRTDLPPAHRIHAPKPAPSTPAIPRHTIIRQSTIAGDRATGT